MQLLRFVLLGLAVIGSIVLGLRLSAPIAPDQLPLATRPPIVADRPLEALLAARLKVGVMLAGVPEYSGFFDRLRLVFPADHAAIFDLFAARIVENEDPGNVDVWLSEAVRTLRQRRGIMASKASPEALARVFDRQLAMLQSLDGTDQRLCVDFLYGGAAPGFFSFAAGHRALVADMAQAGLEAIASGQSAKIDRPPPSDQDFAMLEKALVARGLGKAEISALLDGMTPDPPLSDARMCQAGQVYLEVLAGLPPETRFRVYGLAIELMARS